MGKIRLIKGNIHQFTFNRIDLICYCIIQKTSSVTAIVLITKKQTIKILIIISLLNVVFSCKRNNESPSQANIENNNHELTYDQNKGIINNTNSPYVKLKSIDIGDCVWTEGFWAQKFKQAEEVMVPYMGTLLKGDIGHGYNNFKIAAGLREGEHKGFSWHDGDFYKWMEASMYVYGINKDQKILNELDEIIEVIGKAQQPDGYLSTRNTIQGIEPFSNRRYHELYNSGHLLTSACVHYRLTNKTNFLNIAIKHANLLYKLFQPQPDSLKRFGFNQTQIMGLVELYRTTNDKRYLELAEIFINMRGKSEVVADPTTRGYTVGDMVQERVPLREETEAVGHAVLALYFYAGAADVYAETGEKQLVDALDRLWDNVVNKKMYVTGAVGQTHYGASSRRDKIEEGFMSEYQMPNLTAYNETCANICNSMFSYRMLGLKGESKYADIMELVLYNSALSGIGLNGKEYYYANPLRKIKGALDYEKMNTEYPKRQPYLECFCCPPNLVRTIAKSSGWAYSKSENGIAVNLYGSNKLKTTLLDGSNLKLTQKTDYPWDGHVKISIEECKDSPFDILLRIPNWANDAKILINGERLIEAESGKFAIIKRKWKARDIITIDIPMEIKFIEGHPRIEELRNQVAIKRGPIVYCLESSDIPENANIVDVYVSNTKKLRATFQTGFLGGVNTIEGDLLVRKNNGEGMYREVDRPIHETHNAKFVPYYSWSNRGDTEMTVFMPVIWN